MTALTRLRTVAAATSLALLGAGLAAGLTAPASARTAPTITDLGPTSFAEAGPYAVGERTLRLPSGAAVEVWYPATTKSVKGKPEATYDVVDWLPPVLASMVPAGAGVTYPSGGVRGVPVRSGRYPLVLFSHGYAGFRDQSSFLTSALASWGFVVAAPDHHSRDLTKVLGGPAGTTTDVEDLQATITLVKKAAAKKKGWLHRHVDLTRIGAVGHSAGGRAIEELAATDKRVDTFVGLAGASAGALDEAAVAPDKPGLLMAGSIDGIVSIDRMEAAYAAMRAPKRLVVVENAGHLVFSDLCEVGASDGGLLAIGDLLGVTIPDALRPLATDGCVEPALEPTAAWPAIRQVTVAWLRHVFRIDRSAAGLGGLTGAYPGVISDSRSER